MKNNKIIYNGNIIKVIFPVFVNYRSVDEKIKLTSGVVCAFTDKYIIDLKYN